MYRPCGSFSTNYANDMALIRTPGQWLALASALIVLLCFPLVVSGAWVRFGTICGITVITVLGLQILLGLAGQVSIGQSAFMGVGAYGAAIGATKLGLPFPLPIFFGAVAATVAGLIFGLPAARIKGFYLALTTIAAQFVFQFTVPRLPEAWFGGSAGLSIPPPSLFGIVIRGAVPFYYLTLPVTLLAVLAAMFILRSRVGRALIAVRDNDLAAEVTGINVTYYKVVAFGTASFFAGTAGALLAYENRLAHFEQFTLFESIWYLGMLVVGGLGSILGAVIGAISLRFVQELLTIVSPYAAQMLPGDRYDIAFPMVNVFLGALIIVFLIYQPRGLAHLYRRSERFVRNWPFPY